MRCARGGHVGAQPVVAYVTILLAPWAWAAAGPKDNKPPQTLAGRACGSLCKRSRVLQAWIDVAGLTGAASPSLLLLLRQGLAYLALVGLGLMLGVVAIADGLAHLHGDIRTVMGPCHGNELLHGENS